MSRRRYATMLGLPALAVVLFGAWGCSDGGDDAACTEGTLRCNGNPIEVCRAVVDGGTSTTQWTAVTDCEETEQECTTNAARCGGVGPCCADPA